jgi:hypothetical protein
MDAIWITDPFEMKEVNVRDTLFYNNISQTEVN